MQKLPSIREYSLIYDYVLIKPIDPPATAEGLVRPDQYDDKSEFGVVISSGEGRLMNDGSVTPLHVKPGDYAYFNKYAPSKIRSDGEDLLLMREWDIIAVYHAQDRD